MHKGARRNNSQKNNGIINQGMLVQSLYNFRDNFICIKASWFGFCVIVIDKKQTEKSEIACFMWVILYVMEWGN